MIIGDGRKYLFKGDCINIKIIQVSLVFAVFFTRMYSCFTSYMKQIFKNYFNNVPYSYEGKKIVAEKKSKA